MLSGREGVIKQDLDFFEDNPGRDAGEVVPVTIPIQLFKD